MDKLITTSTLYPTIKPVSGAGKSLSLLHTRTVSAAVALCAWLAIAESHAGLTVIYDSGSARPLSEVVAVPKLAVPEGLPGFDGQSGEDFSAQLFPVHSPGLTPGDVLAQPARLDLPQAFFIIGCDDRSRQWLSQYQARLSQVGAVGLVVEAESLTDFQALAELAHGLPLSPVPASELAKVLGVSHYPVLVSAARIEQ